MPRSAKWLVATLGLAGLGIGAGVCVLRSGDAERAVGARSDEGPGPGDASVGARSREGVRTRAGRADPPAEQPPSSEPPPDSPLPGRLRVPRGSPSPQDEIRSVESLLVFLGTTRPAVPDHSLVGDGERFDRLFWRTAPGPSLRPATEPFPRSPADLSRIAYPAGRHEAGGTLNLDSPEVERPPDAVVAGAGMDETLLVLNAPLTLPPGTTTLILRDLTVDCGDRCLVSGHTVVVRIVRCRVIGFDGGRGDSTVVRGDGAAILAERSRFESGFGSAPGRARLFNTSPGPWRGEFYPTLARFEDCVFAGPFDTELAGRSFYGLMPAQSAVFERCEFRGCTAEDIAEFRKPSGGALFVECDVAAEIHDPASPRTRRSVSEINPAWIDRRADEAAPPK